ncbi:Uncharacterised protein [uncultured archaeon]|nr:Uncharacterised protein [uncultured archaeon]
MQMESIMDFARKNRIYSGEWELSYCDDNYIPEGKFVPFCEIIFDDISDNVDAIEKNYDLIYNAFTLNIYNGAKIVDFLRECWVNSGNFDKETKSFIDDLFQEISKSLTRVGIFTPDVDKPIIDKLTREQILIYVHDTNAIVNGTTNYVLHEFEDLRLWNVIPIFIQLEIQEKAASVKRLETELKNCKYIKDRAFSTNALRVIDQIKKKYPLEYIGDPSELSITKKTTEDKRNVLYDRLIIETIKKLYGSRNINGKVVLVTSDFDMARFAQIENIDVLYSTFKRINTTGYSCYSSRFSLIKKGFHFCSIYDLLWDFTNVFGRIKLENKKDKKTFIFNYYLPIKILLNWQKDLLEIEYIDIGQDFREKISKFADTTHRSIKMIGFDHILDFVEVFSNRAMDIDLETCIDRLQLSKNTCKDYIFVLEGVGLIRHKNGNIIATDLLDIFINEWNDGNTDNLITILRNYVPFNMFLDMMKKIKNVYKFEVNIPETKKILAEHGITDYKAMRVFPNIGEYLGILYPLGDKIYWAYEHPTFEKFEEAFLNAYNKHKIYEGFASIVDIINDVCININISFKTFEQLFNQYHQKNKNILRTGGSVMTQSRNIIQLLNPRSNSQRFNKYVLEDGIMISENVIKSIKLETKNE